MINQYIKLHNLIKNHSHPPYVQPVYVNKTLRDKSGWYSHYVWNAWNYLSIFFIF